MTAPMGPLCLHVAGEGGPVRTFTEASSSDTASTVVAASSLRVGWRVLPGSGREVLDQRPQTVPQLLVIGDLPRCAVDHGAGVVHGVMERRAGIDHTAELGHRDADWRALRGRGGGQRHGYYGD
jgi:hypothetical protein